MRTIYGRQIPAALYKYRPVTTDAQRTWLRQTLLENTAYWASPDEFNDPYDCAPVYRRLEGRELEENVRALVKRVQPELNRAARLRRERELMRTSDAEFEARLAKVRATMRGTAICSLASDPASLLMWSHYGCSHQGICLQFDAAALHDHYTPEGQLGLPVSYSEDRPIITVGSDEEPRELLRKLFLVKAPSWEYEGEWRFIEYPGKPGLRVFPEKALTGIVLGAAMDQATQGFIRSIVAERLSPLPIYRAVLDPIHYRLDVEPVR